MRRGLTFCLASLLLAPGPLLAQQQDSVSADSVPLYRLEGIIVTVARSEDDINKLPYSVGLLGAPQIQGLEATISLEESLVEIPGVFVNNRYNFAVGDKISIRGFGARSQFGVRGIRVIQDGIPLTLPDGQSQLNNLDLASAGRIEVIRGPSSALYGNASGGVINVRTEEAPLFAIQPDLWALVGGYGNERFYQKYDLKVGGRESGFDYYTHIAYFDTEGYRTHSAARYALVNGRFNYRLRGDSDLTLVVNYANTPEAQSPSSLADSVARVKPDTARDLALDPSDCPPDPAFGGCQGLGEKSEQGQLGLTYRRGFSAEHQLTVTGYGLGRSLVNQIPFTLIELDRLVGGTRAEYRFAPRRGRFTGLTAGFDLDYQSDDRLERASDGVDVGPTVLDQDERVGALGLFALGGALLTPGTELTGSLRYDNVRFKVKDHLVNEENPDDSGTLDMDQLSPMIGLRHTFEPWLNVYGNIGRSFQTPTTTELTDSLGGFNEDIRPERATNYEAGLKGTAAARVSYSLSFFFIDVEDLLIGSVAGPFERVFFTNAGSASFKGIEAGLSALLAPDLTLTVAYTYSDFRFDEFVTDDGDFSGNVLPGVSPHTVYGRLSYAPVLGLTGQLEATGVDTYFVDNASQNVNDGYVIVDLRIGYTARIPGFRIVPFAGVNNLFDVRYNSSVVVNAIAGRYYEPAPGRNVYTGLRVKLR
jgi:iron complex outermembrane receptor protein